MGGDVSWTPLFEIDKGNVSESEQLKELNEIEFRNSLLSTLCAINHQLCLLNDRFEEVFETEIEGTDI